MVFVLSCACIFGTHLRSVGLILCWFPSGRVWGRPTHRLSCLACCLHLGQYAFSSYDVPPVFGSPQQQFLALCTAALVRRSHTLCLQSRADISSMQCIYTMPVLNTFPCTSFLTTSAPAIRPHIHSAFSGHLFRAMCHQLGSDVGSDVYVCTPF